MTFLFTFFSMHFSKFFFFSLFGFVSIFHVTRMIYDDFSSGTQWFPDKCEQLRFSRSLSPCGSKKRTAKMFSISNLSLEVSAWCFCVWGHWTMIVRENRCELNCNGPVHVTRPRSLVTLFAIIVPILRRLHAPYAVLFVWNLSGFSIYFQRLRLVSTYTHARHR